MAVQRIEGVGGNQVCVRGTGIHAVFVASRFAAGETIEELAIDYDVHAYDIADAVRAVVSAAFTSRGLQADVERRLEAAVPLQSRTGRPAQNRSDQG